MRKTTLLTLALTASVATAAAPQAPIYIYKLDSPGATIDPRAINDSGQIAGLYTTAEGGAYRGFVTGARGRGTTSLTGPNPAINTIAWGINNDGTVVGEAGDLSGKTRAFVYMESSGMTLLFAGRDSTREVAADINNRGHLVVIALKATDDGSAQNEAFIADTAGAVVARLSDLGGGMFLPRAMNDKDQVVGMSLAADGRYHAVVTGRRGTPTIDLGDMGADQSYAYDINKRGDVVGYTTSFATGQRSTFTVKAGDAQPQMLGNLGIASTLGKAMAPNGGIAGYGTLANGTRVGMMANAAGKLVDVNTAVRNAPVGVRITDVRAVNAKSQAVAMGSDGNAYIMCRTVDCE